MTQKRQTLLLILLSYHVHFCRSADVPLSAFPVYSQVSAWARSCVADWSQTLSISYGCPVDAAACLCTDALKSQRGAFSIRSCASAAGSTNAWTATELWRSYCSINAGVSALDEVLINDIPLFTRVTGDVTRCVTSAAVNFVQTLGCNDYTKAPCLCGASENYNSVQGAIDQCLLYPSNRPSASALWSSYCDVNLKTPAQRVIGSPALTITDAQKPVSTSGSTVRTSTATTGAGSSKTGAAATGTTDSGGNTTNQSSTTATTISPTIISIISVVCVSICASGAYFIARYRRKRLQQRFGQTNNAFGPGQDPAFFGRPDHAFPPKGPSVASWNDDSTVIGPNDSASMVGVNRPSAPMTTASFHNQRADSDHSGSIAGNNFGRNAFRNSLPAQPDPSMLSSGFGRSNLSRQDGRF